MVVGQLARARPSRASFWSGQALAPQRLGQLLAPVLDGVLAALPAEPLADLVAGPGRGDDLQPVARRARPSATFEVKISTVSAELSLVSSGTSRPLTLAPMQRWPTSVWMA